MDHHSGEKISAGTATAPLARAIERHVCTAGDRGTALPELSFHRRHIPTEPVPCIYPLSLAVTVQGEKQVLAGDKVLNCFPGHSLLTTIDLPVVSHVTRATTREPYLGLLLRLDVRAVALAASEMTLPQPDRNRAQEQISMGRLDPALLDALCRLVDLLDDSALLHAWRP
ncbi:MAG: AraC family transcriptional regulator [Blastocatellia bacterium]